jgi:hypothetical protein
MVDKSGRKKFLIKLDLTGALDKPKIGSSDLSYYTVIQPLLNITCSIKHFFKSATHHHALFYSFHIQYFPY